MRDWTEMYWEGYYEEVETVKVAEEAEEFGFSNTMFSNAEITELIYRNTSNDFEE